MKILNILSVILTAILLTSCGANVHTRVSNAQSIALQNNFEQKLVKGGDFLITTFQRISDNHLPYVFYIEGDGHINEGSSISDNPTPANPMLLRLAAIDRRPNIVYIARPCQYTPIELDPKCTSVYWVDKRMSEEVVYSINEVINNVNNGRPFSLVGFSGGGGIAVMVAARNKNTKDIITIAGNLDHLSFSEYHRARALKDSLNPINYALKINNIPQLHLSGAEDTRVPSFIAQRYVRASNSTCVQHKIIKDATHSKNWDNVWNEITSIRLYCL